MNQVESISENRVRRQLKKLFACSRLAESELLRKFLTYIVEETLAGRAEHLKEYNIAVNVLHKPFDFDPRLDGVVRVNARRLRDALVHYYENSGIHDTCRIHIPKGRYVPLFQTVHRLPTNEKSNIIPMSASRQSKKISLLLLPFKTFDPDPLHSVFADHVRLALTAKMATTPELHVIYNHGIRQRFRSIKNTFFEPDYIVTGTADFTSEQFNIVFRLVESSTKDKIWKEEFSFCYDPKDIYKKTSIVLTRILFFIQNIQTDTMQEESKISIPG